MPGKPRLKLLKARRQLLLAESDLNRARLLQEWIGLKGEVHHLTHQIRKVGSIASLAAALMEAFSAWRHGSTGPAGRNGKTSWFSTLLKKALTGASLLGLLKSLFRQRGEVRKKRTR